MPKLTQGNPIGKAVDTAEISDGAVTVAKLAAAAKQGLQYEDTTRATEDTTATGGAWSTVLTKTFTPTDRRSILLAVSLDAELKNNDATAATGARIQIEYDDSQGDTHTIDVVEKDHPNAAGTDVLIHNGTSNAYARKISTSILSFLDGLAGDSNNDYPQIAAADATSYTVRFQVKGVGGNNTVITRNVTMTAFWLQAQSASGYWS